MIDFAIQDSKTHLSYLFAIVLTGLFWAGCSSAKKSPTTSSADSTTQIIERVDTMPTLPQPPITPAPGTVKLTAEVIEHNETTNGRLCLLKIEEVQAYGSSTPPLAVGSEIWTNLSQSVLQHQITAQNGTTDILPPGQVASFTLKFQQAPQLPDIKPTSWHILSIQ